MLKTMHDTVYESIMSVKNIDVSTDNWDPLLCHILTRKLDSSTLIHYECQLLNVKEPQSLVSFLSYLEARFMALQSANLKQENNKPQFINKFEKFEKSDSDKQPKCMFCKGAHFLWKCDGTNGFLKKSVKDRIDFLREKKACLVCFGAHKTFDCKKSKLYCRSCQGRHNSILHLERGNGEKTVKANVATTSEESIKVNVNLACKNTSSVLLATALIGVLDKNGGRVLLRALMDQGSQSAFITESAAQLLKLAHKSINAVISGIGEKEQKAKGAVELTIFPRFQSDFVLSCEAIVLPKLTRVSSANECDIDLDFVNNLTLADPSFLSEGEIDIILGASEYAQIIKSGLIKSDKNLISQNTEFGWMVSGTFNSQVGVRVLSFVTNVELQQSLQNFFKSDEFDNEVETELSEEEMYCEKHFRENVKRNKNGRFVVTLPFKNEIQQPDLGDSRKCAVASLFQLERRFAKNTKLGDEYAKFIREGIALGHIEEVPYSKESLVHYMPHHCVFKDSTTTKLRVVYNGSQKTSNSKSLNEQLAIGRINQSDIFSLLLRFRLFRFVFTADIEKMYKQILLNDNQTDLHRFVYRFSPNEPIRDFRLKTVTFGLANAPYLATRTLEELANLHENSHPLAAQVIRTSMYMDDVLGGCHTLEESIETYHQLKAVFSSACFNLRKWCCNSSSLLECIPDEDREAKALNAQVKALGISWSSQNDMFSYEFSIPTDTIPRTKRQLTSEIAQMFDPLGWIAPVMIRAKSLVQNLWKLKVDWDERVDESYVRAWRNIKNELYLLNELKIPRWTNFDPKDLMEIHGFCDASEIGYAAAVYLKNKTKKTVYLFTAKARVTPLKDDKNDENVTIPRLELCGALLLSQLVKTVLDSLQYKFENVYLWTDSKIVLAWIKANPDKYKSFIASRIRKINKNLGRHSNWYHVASEKNAADCASRGLSPSELINHALWWHGPDFLLDESYTCNTIEEHDTDLGQKTPIVNVSTASIAEFDTHDVATFHELKKRFAMNARQNDNKNMQANELTSDELIIAEKKIVQLLQNESFAEEIKILKAEKKLPKTNKYVSLSLFLDDNMILRVGGRLVNADLPYDTKHQILLPDKHPITALIIEECHEKSMHGGPKLTESILRQTFWICNSQRTIKSILNKCVTCFRVNPKPMEQFMGDLPKSRVTVVPKPFFNTAVDYTGAVMIKMSNGRGFKTQKAYIAIFVCMSTKAIHIEAVSDMTADAFIAAFRRLVARRGAIRNFYSDNGTNFVRANKILQENAADVNESEYNKAICEEFLRHGTKWFFSPPGGPHFNGLAEAGVKSVKHHLKKTIGDSKLSFEELSTLLSQIEACVNTRPLCTLSSSPNDPSALTPSHFLIGEQAILPPEPNYLESKISWLSRWQRVQQMTQYFWKKWQSDYLNGLQVRSKWQQEKEQPKIDDVVLIREENLAPTQWQTGTVIAVHPGDDERTRVVSLKVGDAVFKRPITKICPFPKNEDGVSIVSNHAKITPTEKKMKIASAHKKKSVNVLPILTAVLAIYCTASYSYPLNVSKPFEITSFAKPPGIFFEKQSDVYVATSKWTLVAFIDLKKISDMFINLQTQISEVNFACRTSFNAGYTCEEWATTFETRMTDLNDKFNAITSDHLRPRRAVFDLVGNLAGDVFGILDSRYKKKNELRLNGLMANDEHLMQLVRNQTTIVEKTMNILKINEAELKRQNEQFTYLTNHIGKTTENFTASTFLNDAIAHLLQKFAESSGQIEVLLQSIFDCRRHHLNHNLFPPKQLLAELRLIAEQVRNKYLIPEGNDVYNLIEIEPHVTNNKVFFLLSIPLLRLKAFKNYQIISLPFTLNNESFLIDTPHQYMLVSNDRLQYQFLTSTQLHDCMNYGTKLICWGPYHWNTAQVAMCEWNIFNEISNANCSVTRARSSNFWSDIGHNTWLYYSRNDIDLTLVCDDGVHRTHVTGSGMLRFNENCTIRNFDIEINGKKSFNGKEIEILIPNLSEFHEHTVQLKHVSTESNLTLTDFDELEKTIETIKLQSNLPFLNNHDIHHYIMLYILVAIIVVLALFATYHFNKFKRSFEQKMPTPAPRRISMPNIQCKSECATTPEDSNK